MLAPTALNAAWTSRAISGSSSTMRIERSAELLYACALAPPASEACSSHRASSEPLSS